MNPTAALLVRHPDGEVKRVPFDADRLVVGRTAEAGLRLDHAMISRAHAELWRDAAGNYHVRDLKSRNHTFVNGLEVTERDLEDRDQIGVGPFVITVRLAATTAAESSHSTRIVIGDAIGGRISRLQDHAPPRIDVTQLTTLNAFSRRLLETDGENARAEALCQLAVGLQFRGQWAVIVRISATEKDQPPQLLHEAHGGAVGREPYLSRGVLRLVRESGEAVLASNSGLPAEQEMNVEVSISPQINAMAAVACPIRRSSTEIDVLYVMLPPALGSAEWLALVNLAVQQYQQAESAWASRKAAEAAAVVSQELARARQIQMRLVPAQPKVPGLDLAIGYTPCHGVGGDYVDVVKMPDGRTLLTVADVCGKGLGAALVSSSLHTMVHAGVLGGLGLVALMSNLNEYLCQMLPDDSFVTMVAILLHPATGEGEMVNAGHPPPLLISPGHPPLQLDGEGNLPLRWCGASIFSQRFSLDAADFLALYTDGLSELRTTGSDMLGVEGLAAELQAACAGPRVTAARAADTLARRLAAFCPSGMAADDLTFLLAKRV